MGDEFTQAVPEVPSGDSQEQAQNSGSATTESINFAELAKKLSVEEIDALLETAGVDLTKTKVGQRFQSAITRTANQQLTEAQRAAQAAAAKAQAYEQTFASLDKPVADKLIEDARQRVAQAEQAQEINSLREFKKQTEEHQQLSAYDQQVDQWARGLGLDPNSPDVQQAKNDALTYQTQAPFLYLEQQAKARQQQVPPAPADAGATSVSSTQAPAEQAKRPVAMTPPGGGIAPGSLDDLYEKKALYQKEPTKYARELAQINQEIKQRSQ